MQRGGTGQIMTVLGPIEAERLGMTLAHEHVLVDFVGAETVSRSRYDAAEVERVVLPYLKRAQARGVEALVECTPAYLARDPALLKSLAEATGLHLLTNTGYYGARDGVFLPAHAYRETAEQLGERWVTEWLEGIDGTGVRPGFIKIGVNPGSPLSPMDRKLVQAAAYAHAKTGLTIASHTGTGPALEQLEILREGGVDPSAFIWVHANNDTDPRRHAAVAHLGAWVEFDGVNEAVEADLARLLHMKENGLLGHVLLSHDAGWYDPGNPGRAYRGYEDLFTALLPALGRNGFTEGEIQQLVVDNPARAFSVRVRPIGPAVNKEE